MKEYECVEAKHHMSEGQLKNGKKMDGVFTYQATGNVAIATAFVNDYLLFEKGE